MKSGSEFLRLFYELIFGHPSLLEKQGLNSDSFQLKLINLNKKEEEEEESLVFDRSRSFLCCVGMMDEDKTVKMPKDEEESS